MIIRHVVAQARAELRLMARQGEVLLLTLAIPVILLVFFSQVDVLPRDASALEPIDSLAPGIIALAVMSSSMVSLAIGTGFERQYGVLKRLGATPLGRPALLAAKISVVVIVESIQVGVLSLIAVALGWRPNGNPLLALGAILLASVAFGGLGLLLAGSLSGLMTLASANGLYIILLLIGGMIFPVDRLPDVLETVANLLPSASLSDALSHAVVSGAPIPLQPWIVLACWAVAAPALATRLFRWD